MSTEKIRLCCWICQTSAKDHGTKPALLVIDTSLLNSNCSVSVTLERPRGITLKRMLAQNINKTIHHQNTIRASYCLLMVLLLSTTVRQTSSLVSRTTKRIRPFSSSRQHQLSPVITRIPTHRTMTGQSTDNQQDISKLPTMSTKVQQTLDPCVVLMKQLIGQYADQWKDKGGIFSLAQGVVYWKPPPEATQAMQASLLDDESSLHLYGPDEGLPELRTALQDKIATENGLSNHDVLVTVGANQAYVNAVVTLLNAQDKSVVFAPYYFNHVMALQMTVGDDKVVVGPCTNEGTPDCAWLETALREDSSIRMVTIANPGNPTGTNLDRETLQRIVSLTAQYKVWLVLDCTYEYFVYGDDTFEGCFEDPHVVHIFSFSKAYALAGYRCGYLVVSKDAHLFEPLLKVQDTIPIAPSRISQIAALASMQGPEDSREWVRQKVNTLESSRTAIFEALEPLEQTIGGTGAMYIMAKLPVEDDVECARILVRDFGVAVIPGSFCGFPGWIRVCYSNLPPDLCRQAAGRLAQGIQALAMTE